VSLQKQGAGKGATTAFLISTPESGVDSIAITYALLDPIMTVARPVVAFITATVAGISENVFGYQKPAPVKADHSCPIDNCCDGKECPPEVHRNHHPFSERVRFGIRFALHEVWDDISHWFFIGLLLAGLITSLVPDNIIQRYAGGGLNAMLIMLVVGIPLYICATASTPIAAALILKGVSPGAALVFLLAGPATNVTSITVLLGVLGKRTTVIYFASIAVCTVICGLLLDQIYLFFGIRADAVMGQATELVPFWLKLAGAIVLISYSIRPIWRRIKGWIGTGKKQQNGLVQITASPDTSGADHPSYKKPT